MKEKATTTSIKQQDDMLRLDQEYKHLFVEIKTRIQTSRLQAALAVNREVIQLYWFIGKRIIEKQSATSWGDKLLETLSNDLQQAFPETYGFSKTNLKYMRIFANLYPNGFGQQIVDQLPWGHIMLLIQRVKDVTIRNWYIEQTIKNGWSCYMLEDQIKQDLYKRQVFDGNKTTNFLSKKNIDRPIGISEYELTKALPEKLQNIMPSIKEIEAELNDSEISVPLSDKKDD